MVRGGPEVRFHEGSTRFPQGFHDASTRFCEHRVLLGISPELIIFCRLGRRDDSGYCIASPQVLIIVLLEKPFSSFSLQDSHSCLAADWASIEVICPQLSTCGKVFRVDREWLDLRQGAREIHTIVLGGLQGGSSSGHRSYTHTLHG